MSSLWLITTYFNPLHWSSRRRNYDTFRRHLGANLLTVEWSPSGDFSLREDDADRLVRVSGGDLMWQKERLINIGLSHLPDDCEFVGWVDCDIVFCDPLWRHRAVELLGDHDVVQLFGAVEYQGPRSSLEACPHEISHNQSMRFPSLIQACRRASAFTQALKQDLQDWQTQMKADCLAASTGFASGLGWAAQRAWIDTVGGLPDRAITGGGVTQCAYGLMGHLADYAAVLEHHGVGAYCSEQAHHWAERVKLSLPRITNLEGTILHLYHGDLSDRSYYSRKFELLRTGFLPDAHLELDSGGAWRFSDSAPKTARTVMARYFVSRREDGAPTPA